jgi:hypothetical protein
VPRTPLGLQDLDPTDAAKASNVEAWLQDTYDQAIRDAGGASGVGGYIGQPLPPLPQTIIYPEDPSRAIVAVDGQDATDALNSCLVDLAAAGGGRLQLRDNKTYLVNGTLVTSQAGNAVLAIPLALAGTGFPWIEIRGNGNTILKRTITTDGWSAARGVPSILGGPTDEGITTMAFPTGSTDPTLPNGMLKATVAVRGVKFQVDNSVADDNPKISCVDMFQVGRTSVRDCIFETTGNHDAMPVNTYTFGLRMSGALSLGKNVAAEVTTTGFYTGFVISTSHTRLFHANAKWAKTAVGLLNDGLDPHRAQVYGLVTQHCHNHFAGWTKDAPVSPPTGDANRFFVAGNWDIEDAPWGDIFETQSHILDANDQMIGHLTVNRALGGTGTLSLVDATHPLLVTGGRYVQLKPLLPDTLAVVAISGSAVTLTPPKGCDGLFKVNVLSGTPIVTDIAPGRVGQEITIQAGGTFTISDSAVALRMEGSNAMTTDDTITFVYNGAGWLEKSRRNNA